MSEINEIRRFGKSLRHALRGLRYVLVHERNFQIEIAVALFIWILIIVLKIENWQAVILNLMIMWVLITELTNTVVERVVDMLKPGVHPYARLIKDIMASVVLISSAVAVVVGVIIFWPYLREIMQ